MLAALSKLHAILTDRSAEREFVHSRKNGGILLVLGAVAALLWANLSGGESYFAFWNLELAVGVGDFWISRTLKDWVNEGLMTLFFFVVGLEIKSELLSGELSEPRRAALPALAALGGVLLPAGIYLAFNLADGRPEGWGIPIATDIAFAVCVLALLGTRAPESLKIFLVALATADDIAAVLVIAVFYTAELSGTALGAAGGIFALLAAGNRLHVTSPTVYTVLGIGFWLATLYSGVHATVAGVLLAVTIPGSGREIELFLDEAQTYLARLREEPTKGASGMPSRGEREMLKKLRTGVTQTTPPMMDFELGIAGFVNMIVLPVFALANAGVEIRSEQLAMLASPVALGIIFGLVFGKVGGICGMVWISLRWRLATSATELGWRDFAGVGWIAGIGFTMSLFILELAFAGTEEADTAKIAVLFASVISAAVGTLVLGWRRKPDA